MWIVGLWATVLTCVSGQRTAPFVRPSCQLLCPVRTRSFPTFHQRINIIGIENVTNINLALTVPMEVGTTMFSLKGYRRDHEYSHSKHGGSPTKRESFNTGTISAPGLFPGWLPRDTQRIHRGEVYIVGPLVAPPTVGHDYRRFSQFASAPPVNFHACMYVPDGNGDMNENMRAS